MFSCRSKLKIGAGFEKAQLVEKKKINKNTKKIVRLSEYIKKFLILNFSYYSGIFFLLLLFFFVVAVYGVLSALVFKYYNNFMHVKNVLLL